MSAISSDSKVTISPQREYPSCWWRGRGREYLNDSLQGFSYALVSFSAFKQGKFLSYFPSTSFAPQLRVGCYAFGTIAALATIYKTLTIYQKIKVRNQKFQFALGCIEQDASKTVEAFNKLPILTLNKPIEEICHSDLKEPIMRGSDEGRPFITFKLEAKEEQAKLSVPDPFTVTLFEREKVGHWSIDWDINILTNVAFRGHNYKDCVAALTQIKNNNHPSLKLAETTAST